MEPPRRPGVLRPRSGTRLLADALAAEPLPRARVLELCAGTGADAIRVARGPGVRVEAIRGSLVGRVAGRHFDALAADRRLGRAGLPAVVLARHPGPRGPLMRGRTPMLRGRGLLQDDREELVVVRGTLARGGHDT